MSNTTPEEKLYNNIVNIIAEVRTDPNDKYDAEFAEETLDLIRTTILSSKPERLSMLTKNGKLGGLAASECYNAGIDAAFTAIMEALGDSK